MPRKKFAWASLPDEQLLGLRLPISRSRSKAPGSSDCLKALHESSKA
jgi:hypothetical protein